MGMHLTRLLADGGHDVCVTTRQARENAGRIRYARGDAHDGAFLSELLAARYDCIIDFMAYSTQEFERRVRQLLDACAQYVFLSSSRVYARSLTPLTEDSPRLLDTSDDAEYLATDEYALAKARQENLLTASGKQNFTIIRPYITYAENRLQLGVLEKETWLWTALNLGALIFSSDIAQRRTTLTYGADVARGIAALVGNEAALGETFHITVGESVLWSSVMELYRDILLSRGIKAELVMTEQCHRLSGAGKWQVMFDRYYDRVFDNSKISRFVDTSSFLLPEVGLRKCAESFLDAPRFNYFDLRDILGLLEGTGFKLPLRQAPGIKQKIKYIALQMGVWK